MILNVENELEIFHFDQNIFRGSFTANSKEFL